MNKELTDREVQIVKGLSNGWSNPDIAGTLNLAPNTVKKHLERIAVKLDISGRAGIVGEAFRRGILTVPANGDEYDGDL